MRPFPSEESVSLKRSSMDRGGGRQAVDESSAKIDRQELWDELRKRAEDGEPFTPADVAQNIGAPEAAVPYLERAGVEIEMSGPPGMLSSVRMAQARMALAGARPDPDEADNRTTEAIVASAGRPTEWLARLVRDIADQASTYGHDMGDLVDATFGWQPRPDLT